MVSLETPICEFGAAAIDFELPGVDGKTWNLQSARGEKGLLVMFICNHCPYVKAIRERIVRDVNELKTLGINSVAIMSNDPAEYAEDSFENMAKVSQQFGYPMPYLFDETPDFFGYNADLKLQYRGRLDASRKESAAADVKRDLFDAMRQVAQTGHGPKQQIPSMGCSIKWRES